MRLLFIDYLSPSGHENFDKIHVEALLELGHHITLVGKSGQFCKIKDSPNIRIINLPKWCNRRVKVFAPVLVRLQGIMTLFYIMLKYASNKYDYTIFACYDILSLFLYRSSNKVVLIDHNNIGQLDNWLKLKLTCLYNEYKHVCLSQYMCDRLSELIPSHCIEHVPHGLVVPFENITKPDYLHEDEQFIFCPVNSNFNHSYVSSILNDKTISLFLENNKIIMYIKPIDGITPSESIKIITGRIPENEYNFLIKNATAVVLPYTIEFKYRCSGIFFECVANDVPMICLKNHTISTFVGMTDMYEFEDANSFVSCVKECMKNGRRIFRKDSFYPTNYWANVIN